MTPRRTESEFIRAQIGSLRARLRDLEPPPTREQVKEALRTQAAGSTLKEYARAHDLDLKALYRAAAERGRWEWRVKQYGRKEAGPAP